MLCHIVIGINIQNIPITKRPGLGTTFVSVRFRSERNILLRSFFEFLATYETQKNEAFFS